MIKLILWDLDGTLLDFKKSEKTTLKKAFEKLSLPPLSDKMARRYSEINEECWVKIEKGDGEKSELLKRRFVLFFYEFGLNENLALKAQSLYEATLGDNVFLMPEATETLESLRKDVKQYIVTNGRKDTQIKKLKTSGIGEISDGIFISDDVGFEKPNKKFFDHVLKNDGDLLKDEIMIVGDSITSDILGGNNAGILTCLFDPYSTSAETDLKTDYKITSLSKVIKIVKERE